MDLTIGELGRLLRQRKLSPVELTSFFLNEIDKKEADINAFIYIDRDGALKRAGEMEKKFAGNFELSPLAGIPAAIKDNICIEGLPATCGSRMLENFVAPYTATAAKKLIDSGAVVIGKTNMDEFAMGSSTESSYFKKTANPVDISRVPGGSSGGSAACVKAEMAAYSLGSDTGGSIRQPASYCGVVGLKPTYGSVSRYGLVAYASSLDQIGPLTRTVEDCALVFSAIAGKDGKDATSSDFDHPDYIDVLNKTADSKLPLAKTKIGVPEEFIGSAVDEDVRKNILNSLDDFKRLGATWETFSFPVLKYGIPAYYLIALAEASSNLARYDGIKYGYSSNEFDDLDDFYKRTRSEGFGIEVKRRILLGTYALSSGYYDAYYKKAQKAATIITRKLLEAFDKYDLIMGPVAPDTAFKLGEKINDPVKMYMGDIFTVPVNIAGLPAISIPCGKDSGGLPIGLQIIGRHFDESAILRTAYIFEKFRGL